MKSRFPKGLSHQERTKALEKLYELGKRAGLWDNRQFQQELFIFSCTGNQTLLKGLESQCTESIKYVGSEPLLPFVSPITAAEVSGEIALGTVATNKDITYCLESVDGLSKSMAIFGPPGVGKTSLLKQILISVFKRKVPVIIFDSKGGDFPEFIRKNAVYVRAEELLWNILRPPANVSMHRWVGVLSESICEALRLLDASWSMLARTIRKTLLIYQKRGVFPTFLDVVKVLESEETATYKTQGYIDTILNRLKTIEETAGFLLNARKGFIETIIENDISIIIDTSGINTVATNLIVEVMFSYIWCYHDANGLKNTGCRRVIVVEEAQEVALSYTKENVPRLGSSLTNRLISQGRAFGIAIIGVSQRVSQVTQELLANAATKIVFNLGSGQEIDLAGYALGLTQEQIFFLRHMGVGDAIVKTNSGFTHPCLIKAFLPVLEQPTAEDWQRNAEWVRQLRAESEMCKDEDVDEKAFLDLKLRDNSKLLLTAIGEYPMSTLTAHYAHAGLSAQTAGTAKKQLIHYGLIKEYVLTGGGSGQPRILSLTIDGEQVFSSINGKDPNKLVTTLRASIPHDWHVNNVAEHHRRQGATVMIGRRFGRQEVDVCVEKDGKTMAMEVTLSEGNVDTKLSLLDHVDSLCYLCINKAQIKTVQDRLDIPEEHKDRVKFLTLSSFM